MNASKPGNASVPTRSPSNRWRHRHPENQAADRVRAYELSFPDRPPGKALHTRTVPARNLTAEYQPTTNGHHHTRGGPCEPIVSRTVSASLVSTEAGANETLILDILVTERLVTGEKEKARISREKGNGDRDAAVGQARRRDQFTSPR